MKISIITAVFNNREFIEDAIKSVLSQTYSNKELIIIDGGSTDGTLEVIDRYRDNINNLVSSPDRGMYDALNKGIQLATGDIIGLLHSDDLYENSNILTKVCTLFEKSQPDAVYGDLIYSDKNDINKVIRYWKAGEFTLPKINQGWMPPHPTLFVRRDVYRQLGGYNSNFKIASDYDLILRFFHKHRISVAYLPEVLIRMRVGGKSNRSIKNIIRKSWEDYKALNINEIKNPVFTLVLKNLTKLPQFFTSQSLQDEKNNQ